MSRIPKDIRIQIDAIKREIERLRGSEHLSRRDILTLIDMAITSTLIVMSMPDLVHAGRLLISLHGSHVA